MYYQNYEDYMRSVLGYPSGSYSPNTYYNDGYSENMMQQQTNTIQDENPEWYPEIYKIVYPMVRKTCDDNRNAEITEDLIENMTNIVYTNIEVGDIDVSGNQSQSINQPQELRNGDVPNPRVKAQSQETRETRQLRHDNPLLRDLIRILILRELFDRRRPNRPPFPGRPGHGIMHPPFPRYY